MARAPQSESEADLIERRLDLHAKAREQFFEIEKIVDQLKRLGRCPMNGDNALLNIRERALGVADRIGHR